MSVQTVTEVDFWTVLSKENDDAGKLSAIETSTNERQKNMYQSEVRFHSAEQIHSFVNAMSHCDSAVRFRTEKGTVNAKSILGVFSMDFSKPLYVQYDAEDAGVQRVLRSYRT